MGIKWRVKRRRDGRGRIRTGVGDRLNAKNWSTHSCGVKTFGIEKTGRGGGHWWKNQGCANYFWVSHWRAMADWRIGPSLWKRQTNNQGSSEEGLEGRRRRKPGGGKANWGNFFLAPRGKARTERKEASMTMSTL